jgi:hypothetical protein
MKLVQASDAIRLSGLTAHQLREWCGRRAIVTPDVPAAGRGRHALFSWQTILALRVLNEVHSRFFVEVSAWSEAIAQSQMLLRGNPFMTLWGTAIVFPNTKEAKLTHDHSDDYQNACMVVRLDPHLSALATAGVLPPEQQFPLFAALAVNR